jgi:hypothetical protein
MENIYLIIILVIIHFMCRILVTSQKISEDECIMDKEKIISEVEREIKSLM